MRALLIIGGLAAIGVVAEGNFKFEGVPDTYSTLGMAFLIFWIAPPLFRFLINMTDYLHPRTIFFGSMAILALLAYLDANGVGRIQREITATDHVTKWVLAALAAIICYRVFKMILTNDRGDNKGGN